MLDKHYDHNAHESQAQEQWSQENTYSLENNPGILYSIDTPPPTVSGALHIGHIFSYTHTDIIARYKRMSGYSVFYPFGFDDNGLPTERFVEQKNNIKAYELSRSDFIKLCLQETQEVEEKFKSLWQKMGLSVDWSLLYSTISDSTRKISQASFIDLYKKGYIYRKEAPVLYCTNCQTAVAQAELDDTEKPTLFNDIIFQGPDGEKLTISTTRPELLPSCVALVYHPEDTRYKHLKNKQALVPLYDYQVPFIQDELVNPEKGTGLVMVCTFGDKTDIEWYQRYNLCYRQSIDSHGKWKENTGPLAGMRVASARKKALELLKEQGLITNQKDITHTVNIHERCKKEIEYLILPQWFLKIIPYKEEFLKIGEEITWYPEFMKPRYKNWVENISWDWCLSRQRFYGIPFPAWHCMDCNEIILAEENQLPVDPQETQAPTQCTQCTSSNMRPDTDIMDTWNTSSITPFICQSLYNQSTDSIFNNFNNQNSKNASDFLPMSMRPQAHDIIRTWAFYTIVKSWMHTGEKPWNTIVISGHVLSTEKEKISKSRGNAPLDPFNLLKEYPADAIRYWTASGALGYDTAFSPNQLKIGQKLLVKLWNAFKFSYSYLENVDTKSFTLDFNDAEDLKKLSTVNQWILDRATLCFKTYENYFKNNEFSLALDTVEKFFWSDYCDNYLELIKDQLMFSDKYDEQEVNATLWTLYTLGLRILQLYSPFIPHITESLYSLIYKKSIKASSIHQTKFKAFQKSYAFADSVQSMNAILEIISTIRKLKSENQLSLKTELSTLTIAAQPKILEKVKSEESLIKGITKAHTIYYENTAHKATELVDKQEQWHATVFLSEQI